MDKLYIVIPAYNEAANIGSVVEEWYPLVEKHNGGGQSRLVVIDDGSKDDTYKIIAGMAEDRPLLVALTKQNSGHGATILYGYRYALDAGADFVFQTDSDGQTLPEEFEPFWDLREEYDLIIGNRSGRKDGIARVFVTKVLKQVIRICFGVTVTDANTPYRLMGSGALEANLKLVPDHYELTNVALSVIAMKRGDKVKFLPITFRPRQGGVNSMNMKKIFATGKRALRDFRRINKLLK